MNNFQKNYFYLLSFSPLFAYLLYNNDIVPYKTIGVITDLYVILGVLFGNLEIKRFPSYFTPLIILIFYYLGWDIYNESFEELNFGMYIYRNLPIHTFFALLIIENTKFNELFLNKILKIFKYSIVLSFIFVIIQLTINPKFFMPTRVNYELMETFQYFNLGIFGFLSLNELDMSLLPILSIFLGFYLLKTKKINLYMIIFAGLIAISSNARSTQISFLIVLLQITFFHKNIIKKGKYLFYILTSIIIVIILFFNFTGFDPNIYLQKRILSESADSRIYAWEMLAKYFPKNPLFGVGKTLTKQLSVDLNGISSQIHVGYASHLFAYGAIGSFFLFWFWFSILKYFYKTARLSNFYGSLFGFLVFLFINLTMPKFYIYSYGILFLFVFNKFFYDSNKKLYINKI